MNAKNWGERLRNSLAMQERAKRRIPGMTQLLSKRPDMFSQGIWPGYFSKAKGAHVWDLDENVYLDMSISGIGANVLGYADPDVDQAVTIAIAKGTSCSLNCPEEVELADLLCELHPWADMVRYARTGGEAMAIAVRIARAHTGKDKIAFCGYHGWHDWYLSANLTDGNALSDHLLSGLSPAGVPRALVHTAFPFRYNRLEELHEIISAHGRGIAAIVMEPIRNQYPDPGFIEGVRAIADDLKAVFIMDEISSGFRLTTGGAHLQLTTTTPDIAVFSKAMGNGYPIAAVIGKCQVMEAAQLSFISSTNWTEKIGPAAAIATIRKHRAENVASHLQKTGKSIQQGWGQIANKHCVPITVTGIAPLSHFSFESEPESAGAMKAYFIQTMLDKGFLASNLFYSMYAHTEDDVIAYLGAVDETFGKLSDIMNNKNIFQELHGLPARSGFKRLT
jgi:glutamate-1-semialdehyde 2,1-aminomutase